MSPTGRLLVAIIVMLVIMLILIGWMCNLIATPEVEVQIIQREDNIIIPDFLVPPTPTDPAPTQERHANDSQNVHDHTIVKHLTKRWNRIVELNAVDYPDHQPTNAKYINDSQWAIQHCIQTYLAAELTAGRLTEAEVAIRTSDMIAVLNAAKNATTIALTGATVAEQWILAEVWSRINAPANTAHLSQLKENLCVQIFSAVERPEIPNIIASTLGMTRARSKLPVCIGGRIARYLDCFTLIDADPIIAKPPLDKAELTNLAYTTAAKMRADAVGNPDNATVAPLYEGKRAAATPKEQELLDGFTVGLKSEIESSLRREYTGFTDDRSLNDIIASAVSAI